MAKRNANANVLKTTNDSADPTAEMWVAITRRLERLRPGEVQSYGSIATQAGYPRRHRAVGQLLSTAVDALPWWRVVYSSGHLPPVNPTLQAIRLREEGVTLDGTKVVRSLSGLFASGPKASDR